MVKTIEENWPLYLQRVEAHGNFFDELLHGDLSLPVAFQPFHETVEWLVIQSTLHPGTQEQEEECSRKKKLALRGAHASHPRSFCFATLRSYHRRRMHSLRPRAVLMYRYHFSHVKGICHERGHWFLGGCKTAFQLSRSQES